MKKLDTTTEKHKALAKQYDDTFSKLNNYKEHFDAIIQLVAISIMKSDDDKLQKLYSILLSLQQELNQRR